MCIKLGKRKEQYTLQLASITIGTAQQINIHHSTYLSTTTPHQHTLRPGE